MMSLTPLIVDVFTAVMTPQPGRALTASGVTPQAASPSRMIWGSAAITFSSGIEKSVGLSVVIGSPPASVIISS
jgi:hypothetical protein